MLLLSRIFGTLLLLGVIGCTASESRSEWVRQHGGLLGGDYQDRARRVSASLLSQCRSENQNLTVSVLDAEVLGAFGWRDGQIYVTRGLVTLLDDDELAAVVSHELGHLLDRGHLHAVAGLQGCR